MTQRRRQAKKLLFFVFVFFSSPQFCLIISLVGLSSALVPPFILVVGMIWQIVSSRMISLCMEWFKFHATEAAERRSRLVPHCGSPHVT
jgi:hypothetical protein